MGNERNDLQMKIKVLSGTFEKGCGVIVHHIQSDNFYHLIVFEDKETEKPFVEIKDKRYFAEDIEVKSMNKKKYREIALKLMLEQLRNTPYSLEREEYKDLSMEEIETINFEIDKVCDQFKKRYNM